MPLRADALPQAPGKSQHGPLLFGTPLRKMLDTFGFAEGSGHGGQSSRISHEELGSRLRDMGYNLEPSEVERLAEILDSSETGKVHRAAFAASLVDWREMERSHKDQWLELLERAFREMDRDSDGTLQLDDLVRTLRRKLPPAEVRAAVEQAMVECGCDQALGEISFEGFVRLMRTNSTDSLASLDLYDDRYVSRGGTTHGGTNHGGSGAGGTSALDALKAAGYLQDRSNHGPPKDSTVREAALFAISE